VEGLFVMECAALLYGRKVVVRTGERPTESRGQTRTKCGCVQAITHPPPEVPPPVSNSTGKSCCSPEVVSEGAKKEKKESISVRMGGVGRICGMECCGSGSRMTGWEIFSHPRSPYIYATDVGFCVRPVVREIRDKKASLREFIRHEVLSVRVQAYVPWAHTKRGSANNRRNTQSCYGRQILAPRGQGEVIFKKFRFAHTSEGDNKEVDLARKANQKRALVYCPFLYSSSALWASMTNLKRAVATAIVNLDTS